MLKKENTLYTSIKSNQIPLLEKKPQKYILIKHKGTIRILTQQNTRERERERERESLNKI